MHRISTGLTFLEILIIAACIGLLAVVTLPALQSHQGKQVFPELALAAGSRVEAIEKALHENKGIELGELDAGMLGIPDNVSANTTSHGAMVQDGQILMQWRNDSTFLQGTTLVLTPASDETNVVWQTGGSCLGLGLC